MAQKQTFAERMLTKNGWQHGEGLGKNNQGKSYMYFQSTYLLIF